ncbi:MAG: hypothetical protein BWX58_01263 [Deltaproteobacteria bacterium ADurb.Bin026]|nr:MAG: hypothetical protein BWX58_01263 [Deltaproteobacteria bacterium ADurb.Bin026]
MIPHFIGKISDIDELFECLPAYPLLHEFFYILAFFVHVVKFKLIED